MLDDIKRQIQLSKALCRAADLFRGMADHVVSKDLVLAMLFLKYVSDCEADLTMQDLTTGRSSKQLAVPTGARFQALLDQSDQPGNGRRIDAALLQIEAANRGDMAAALHGISFDVGWLGDEVRKDVLLKALLRQFDSSEFDLRPSHCASVVLGSAVEYYLKHVAADSAKVASESLTPTEVCELMAALMKPQPHDDICDPACGLGFLLLKCAQRVQQAGGEPHYQLFGQEKNSTYRALANLNLYLHGERQHRLMVGDTLRDPKLLDQRGQLQQFDVVVSNPPFSLQQWGHDKAQQDVFRRFWRGLPPPSKGDFAFIQHMVETLKPGSGRMAVLVPHGVLFRGAAEGQIRRQLIEEGLVDAVIGLPPKLLFSVAIPTAVLVLRKTKADDKVLFIDASGECRPGKVFNTLGQGNIARILQTYEERCSVAGHAYLATLDEIAAHEHKLSIPLYVKVATQEETIDLDAVRAERAALVAELAYLEAHLAQCLQEAGYA